MVTNTAVPSGSAKSCPRVLKMGIGHPSTPCAAVAPIAMIRSGARSPAPSGGNTLSRQPSLSPHRVLEVLHRIGDEGLAG
jgi:hypothetical protein